MQYCTCVWDYDSERQRLSQGAMGTAWVRVWRNGNVEDVNEQVVRVILGQMVVWDSEIQRFRKSESRTDRQAGKQACLDAYSVGRHEKREKDRQGKSGNRRKVSKEAKSLDRIEDVL